MNFYRNLSIKRQLMIIVTAMVVGFIAIGFAYYGVLSVQNEVTAELQRATTFGNVVEKARNDLLTSQRFGKDFQITHELEHMEGFDTTIARGLETMSRLEVLLSTEDAENLKTRLIGPFENYQSAVYEVAEAQLNIGLDAASGLLADLTDSAESLDTAIGDAGSPRVQAAFLMMRAYEKDYLFLEQSELAQSMANAYSDFQQVVKKSVLSNTAKSELLALADEYYAVFIEVVDNVELRNSANRNAQTIADQLGPEFDRLIEQAEKAVVSTRQESDKATGWITTVFAFTLLLIFGIMTGLLLLLARKLTKSFGRLQHTVVEVGKGKLDVRSQLETKDELGMLSEAFDTMLDERLTEHAKTTRENEQINDSVINLMEAVSQLSEKDLTITVPVSEDVTGPVSDAINLMADETSKVLSRINRVALDVSKVANAVKGQGNAVSKQAADERMIVDTSITQLNKVAKTMAQMAEQASSANDTAIKASDSTKTAVEAVLNTADGMNDIRETISETEKRIKRLGECSQEINSVVTIINKVAERTHVLALNASMQAAGAGEAGRGFAVVADEVQRLAESSQNSTSQIAALVNNIQAETAETMATMNKTIGQVVAVSEMAQKSGQQMQTTQTYTSELAESVQQIASSSMQQAEQSNEMQSAAEQIKTSTELTHKTLQTQAGYTEKLVQFSKALVSAVSVFKLPSSVMEVDEPPVLVASEQDLNAVTQGQTAQQAG